MTSTAVSRGQPVRFAVCGQALLLTLMLSSATPQAVVAAAAERVEHRSPAVSIVDAQRPARSYALVRQNGGTVFVGQQDELRQFRHAKTQVEAGTVGHADSRQRAGDYLWLRDGEQHYVIDDPALLAEVLALWRSVEPHQQALEKLNGKMQKYTDQLEQHAALLEDAMVDGEPVNVAAIEAFERVSAPLQAQIEPLGEQMEALGQQIEAGSDKAHQRTLTLIQSAMASGAAKPVPSD